MHKQAPFTESFDKNYLRQRPNPNPENTTFFCLFLSSTHSLLFLLQPPTNWAKCLLSKEIINPNNINTMIWAPCKINQIEPYSKQCFSFLEIKLHNSFWFRNIIKTFLSFLYTWGAVQLFLNPRKLLVLHTLAQLPTVNIRTLLSYRAYK